MTSFYHITSRNTGTHSDKHPTLKAAYGFYTLHTYTPLVDIMQDLLITAYTLGFDVFHQLNIMDLESVLKPLKFSAGKGILRYYVFNWKFTHMKSSQLGLMML